MHPSSKWCFVCNYWHQHATRFFLVKRRGSMSPLLFCMQYCSSSFQLLLEIGDLFLFQFSILSLNAISHHQNLNISYSVTYILMNQCDTYDLIQKKLPIIFYRQTTGFDNKRSPFRQLLDLSHIRAHKLINLVHVKAQKSRQPPILELGCYDY